MDNDLLIISAALERESRSLLHYLRDSYPWTPTSEQDKPDQIRRMADEQFQALGAMTRYLLSHRQSPPQMGFYPSSFTSINYAALDHLLPQVLADEKQLLSQLESDGDPISDSEGRGLLQSLADLKRGHIAKIQEMIHPAVGVS